jgi:hypothetical protein
MIPLLSPKRSARHAWDMTQFPSDVEASCSSPCSCSSLASPSPEYLGRSVSQSALLHEDHQRRRNAECTSEDGYADDDGEFDYWARLKLHPEPFTHIDGPSIHAEEVCFPLISFQVSSMQRYYDV